MKTERKEQIEVPKIESISDRISYLTATEYPLSANVVLIEGDTVLWVYVWEIILRFRGFCMISQNRQEKKFGS